MTMMYITDSREASPTAISSAKQYVTATYKQRISTLQDSTVFPGLYVFNDKQHVKPIFFPKEVSQVLLILRLAIWNISSCTG